MEQFNYLQEISVEDGLPAKLNLYRFFLYQGIPSRMIAEILGVSVPRITIIKARMRRVIKHNEKRKLKITKITATDRRLFLVAAVLREEAR